MRSPRVALVLALAAGALVALPMQSSVASRPEGCVVTNPANPQYANPCTYRASAPGGIVGGGGFKVTIKRGKKTLVFTDKKSNNYAIGTIKPGDSVTAQATGSMSFVAVGNPCPSSIPGAC